MSKHFTAALVAVSALVASASHSAFARHPSHGHFARGPSRTLVRPIPSDTSTWAGETGTASYYSQKYHGRRSASGARFDQQELTAAHPWLPFGTRIRVMLADTGRSVIVTITDRIYSSRRVVDLSVAAARELGMLGRGIAHVTIVLA